MTTFDTYSSLARFLAFLDSPLSASLQGSIVGHTELFARGSAPSQSRKILGASSKAIELPNPYMIWQSVEGEVDAGVAYLF